MARQPKGAPKDPNAPRPGAARRERADAVAAADPYHRPAPQELRDLHAGLIRQLGGPSAILKAISGGMKAGRLGLENIRGVYIGRKYRDGRPTDQMCIKVQVGTKVRDRSQIDSNAEIPPFLTIGGTKYPTDVEAIHRFRPHLGYKEREEPPAKCGSSISARTYGLTGTIGAVVLLEDGNKRCILSNNHVLASTDRLSPGEDILQPGLADAQGDPHNTYRLGSLERAIPIRIGGTNTVDAAVAWVYDGAVTVSHHEFTIVPEPRHPAKGMGVMKEGRSTGLRNGTIVDVDWAGPVDYTGLGGTGTAWFEQQILIQGDQGVFSDEGDSGSLVVHRESKNPLGLLLGGSESGYTIANPILEVMDQLQIKEFA
jgi:hypothetical protein